MIRYLLLCLLITGCNLAPHYDRPSIEIPPDWRFDYDPESTCCNICWWEELGDPILDGLILQALKSNKNLQIAIWRVCEFYGKCQMFSSKMFPKIDLHGSAFKEKFPPASFIPSKIDSITPNYSYDFNLVYELDFWGRVRNMSQSAYRELLSQVENRRTVILTLVSEVANSYIRLREFDQELLIAHRTEKDREKYLEIARKRFQGGLTSKIEVEQAMTILEESRSLIVQIEERILTEENLLSLLLGEPPTSILRGRAVSEFVLPPRILVGLPSDLLERRPDIIAAEQNLIAANARIGVARAEFFPKISILGILGAESFKLHNFFDQRSRAWTIGGEFIQSIFRGWRLVGQLNVSIASYRELLYQYEQTILTAFQEVSNALIAHQKSRELVHIDEKKVEALHEYLKLAWLRYENGETDYLTVLDAERELFSAQIDLTQTQGEIFLSLVAIYKAVGGGWVWQADNTLVTEE
ncbi:MAG: efflux transporter outer membrane subunit [Chlamydiales bacterium]